MHIVLITIGVMTGCLILSGTFFYFLHSREDKDDDGEKRSKPHET